MVWLKEWVGFMSWRFDFVRGYAPGYVSEYVRKTIGDGRLCVGENWVNMKYVRQGCRCTLLMGALLMWVCSTLSAVEYTTPHSWEGSFLSYHQDNARQQMCDWINATGTQQLAILPSSMSR